MVFHNKYFPERIVCLTEESTELIYMLGEQQRIVGISGFTVRPPEARKTKPKISTFMDAQYDEIVSLKPDLVIGFSDIQAEISKELIARGITVWINNHRSIQEIFNFMVQLGSLINQREKAIEIVEDIKRSIHKIYVVASRFNIKPKVYFEEWYDPLISCIRWVHDIIEISGGINIFPDKSFSSLAKGRIVTNPELVVQKNPDLILASWCGKKLNKQRMTERNGWHKISAIKNHNIFEISSDIILQPGPAALIEGIPLIHDIILNWVKLHK